MRVLTSKRKATTPIRTSHPTPVRLPRRRPTGSSWCPRACPGVWHRIRDHDQRPATRALAVVAERGRDERLGERLVVAGFHRHRHPGRSAQYWTAGAGQLPQVYYHGINGTPTQGISGSAPITGNGFYPLQLFPDEYDVYLNNYFKNPYSQPGSQSQRVAIAANQTQSRLLYNIEAFARVNGTFIEFRPAASSPSTNHSPRRLARPSQSPWWRKRIGPWS